MFCCPSITEVLLKGMQNNHHPSIIPIPHQYAYFEQFDWLEKRFHSLINSMSMNLGTSFLLLASNMYNNVDKNKILMEHLE